MFIKLIIEGFKSDKVVITLSKLIHNRFV